MTLQLQGGAELSAGHAEVCRQDGELLNALSVGRGLGVGAVDALLNEASQPEKPDAAALKRSSTSEPQRS